MDKTLRFETHAVRRQAKKSLHKEHSVPVFETSSFIFDTAEEAQAVFAEEREGNIYTRYSNPNSDELIDKLCKLEGAGDGIATASGMAAVFLGFFTFLRPGDHILVSRNIFGTTHLLITQVLSKWGISHTYVGMENLKEVEEKILPMTKILYAESPANPGLDILDLGKLGKLAQKKGLYFLFDNCFATPYLQNPLRYGADLVIHSTTKFIDGQGRTIGGAILGSAEYINEVRQLARITGPTMSPHTAWLLSKSLETLSVRMEKHCQNALMLAQYLEKNPDTKWVRYPFLPSHPQFNLARKQMKMGGGLVSFELHGGSGRAMKFVNALKLMSITSNLGDTRTTITHPATTTHSKLTPEEKKESGITDGMLRVSVGLESIDDIIEDVEHAILHSRKP
ncbi:MAG: aminotransferase class I/II-fold pyridoxal phosphate-dependent enzyme [Bacteroidales bacterium]|nr:aminotransferase class I/II-fold pyridoxal phosphate-dependent enzyme [Bacteroidales bacterium]